VTNNNSELAANLTSACDVGTPTRFPVRGRKKAPGYCLQCGHSLIRGFGVSVCENFVCDSLPKNITLGASLEAWAGL
jgi:hypothetical protein